MGCGSSKSTETVETDKPQDAVVDHEAELENVEEEGQADQTANAEQDSEEA